MRVHCQAVLFDVDGTLVDSIAVVERAWRTWAAEYGVDPDTVLRQCHGRRSADTVALFLPPEQHATALAMLDDLEFGGDITALPGARELLSRLPAGRWAAVSSGTRRLMGERLRAAGLLVPTVVIGADDVRAGKPDPEGYLAAAAALGHDIRDCVVVEDAPAGIRAGRAAGATVVAVATTLPPGDLGEADHVVRDLGAVSAGDTADGIVLVA